MAASKTSFDTASTYSVSSTATTLKGDAAKKKKWFSLKKSDECTKSMPKYKPAERAAERALHNEAVLAYLSNR
ncbi:uncharacterized protein LDX57_001413 [Aspergillus melleus]|uniref:uncharacterized protein n=1 Tax=Aspergillus melleus TaxID=138277 RepID=UPI001E8DA033|nr:uncharacterized protein LDX57_001413 [Aspergillus melleus]KAH8423654.1 hypothetical protein LDX57_001413 [Aspergillus melleus]